MPDSAERIIAFGKTSSGEKVEAVELCGHGLRARILTFGAILQDLRLDRVAWPLTLGSDDLAAYEGPMRYFGAVVGPVANRISGASAVIGGRRHVFEANENAATTLHGGKSGTDARLWRIEAATPDRASLALRLPDGLGGFPGNRDLGAEFSLGEGPSLSIRLSATTDAPTLINLANHSYWNLDASDTIAGHRLRVAADSYLPVDGRGIPVGGPAPVAGSPFDLRKGRTLAAQESFDHNFCLCDADREMTEVAELSGARGLRMRLETTAPGLQVYDGRGLATGAFRGHSGRPYGAFAGIALETQAWPDAPHHPGFPPILLLPGQTYEQRLRFRFEVAPAT